ncbi:hypothetical protein [Serratia liquefaciens]|uniref:hypothetical protein n=1 Tax=Serratia liquefaciens TaxID=614 RepID=UPI003905B1FB
MYEEQDKINIVKERANYLSELLIDDINLQIPIHIPISEEYESTESFTGKSSVDIFGVILRKLTTNISLRVVEKVIGFSVESNLVALKNIFNEFQSLHSSGKGIKEKIQLLKHALEDSRSNLSGIALEYANSICNILDALYKVFSFSVISSEKLQINSLDGMKKTLIECQNLLAKLPGTSHAIGNIEINSSLNTLFFFLDHIEQYQAMRRDGNLSFSNFFSSHRSLLEKLAPSQIEPILKLADRINSGRALIKGLPPYPEESWEKLSWLMEALAMPEVQKNLDQLLGNELAESVRKYLSWAYKSMSVPKGEGFQEKLNWMQMMLSNSPFREKIDIRLNSLISGSENILSQDVSALRLLDILLKIPKAPILNVLQELFALLNMGAIGPAIVREIGKTINPAGAAGETALLAGTKAVEFYQYLKEGSSLQEALQAFPGFLYQDISRNLDNYSSVLPGGTILNSVVKAVIDYRNTPTPENESWCQYMERMVRLGSGVTPETNSLFRCYLEISLVWQVYQSIQTNTSRESRKRLEAVRDVLKTYTSDSRLAYLDPLIDLLPLLPAMMEAREELQKIPKVTSWDAWVGQAIQVLEGSEKPGLRQLGYEMTNQVESWVTNQIIGVLDEVIFAKDTQKPVVLDRTKREEHHEESTGLKSSNLFGSLEAEQLSLSETDHPAGILTKKEREEGWFLPDQPERIDTAYLAKAWGGGMIALASWLSTGWLWYRFLQEEKPTEPATEGSETEALKGGHSEEQTNRQQTTDDSMSEHIALDMENAYNPTPEPLASQSGAMNKIWPIAMTAASLAGTGGYLWWLIREQRQQDEPVAIDPNLTRDGSLWEVDGKYIILNKKEEKAFLENLEPEKEPEPEAEAEANTTIGSRRTRRGITFGLGTGRYIHPIHPPTPEKDENEIRKSWAEDKVVNEVENYNKKLSEGANVRAEMSWKFSPKQYIQEIIDKYPADKGKITPDTEITLVKSVNTNRNSHLAIIEKKFKLEALVRGRVNYTGADIREIIWPRGVSEDLKNALLPIVQGKLFGRAPDLMYDKLSGYLHELNNEDVKNNLVTFYEFALRSGAMEILKNVNKIEEMKEQKRKAEIEYLSVKRDYDSVCEILQSEMDPNEIKSKAKERDALEIRVKGKESILNSIDENMKAIDPKEEQNKHRIINSKFKPLLEEFVNGDNKKLSLLWVNPYLRKENIRDNSCLITDVAVLRNGTYIFVWGIFGESFYFEDVSSNHLSDTKIPNDRLKHKEFIIQRIPAKEQSSYLLNDKVYHRKSKGQGMVANPMYFRRSPLWVEELHTNDAYKLMVDALFEKIKYDIDFLTKTSKETFANHMIDWATNIFSFALASAIPVNGVLSWLLQILITSGVQLGGAALKIDNADTHEEVDQILNETFKSILSNITIDGVTMGAKWAANVKNKVIMPWRKAHNSYEQPTNHEREIIKGKLDVSDAEAQRNLDIQVGGNTDSEIRTKYDSYVTTLKTQTSSQFNAGVEQFKRDGTLAHLVGKLPHNYQMMKDTQLINEVFIGNPLKLKPYELGEVSEFIRLARKQAEIQEVALKAMTLASRLSPGTTRLSLHPQTLLTEAAGKGSRGRCRPLAYAMEVAIHNGRSEQMLENLGRVRAQVDLGAGRRYIEALDAFHDQNLEAIETAVTVGNRASLSVSEIVGQLKKEPGAASFSLRTNTHAMSVGVSVKDNGAKRYHFYDPNIGLVKYSSLEALGNGLDKTIGDKQLAKFYGADDRRYNLYRLDVDALAKTQITRSPKWTIADFSERKQPDTTEWVRTNGRYHRAPVEFDCHPGRGKRSICNTATNYRPTEDLSMASMARPLETQRDRDYWVGEVPQFIDDLIDQRVKVLFSLDDELRHEILPSGVAKDHYLKQQLEQSGIEYVIEPQNAIEDGYSFGTNTDFTQLAAGDKAKVTQIASLVDQINIKRQANPDHVVAVHCGAGDGRSGTVKSAVMIKKLLDEKPELYRQGVVADNKKAVIHTDVPEDFSYPIGYSGADNQAYKVVADAINEVRKTHVNAVERVSDVNLLNAYARSLLKRP